jgi:hypothetical protein
MRKEVEVKIMPEGWSPKEIWISDSGKITGRSGGCGGTIWEFSNGVWKEVKQHPLYYEPY